MPLANTLNIFRTATRTRVLHPNQPKGKTRSLAVSQIEGSSATETCFTKVIYTTYRYLIPMC